MASTKYLAQTVIFGALAIALIAAPAAGAANLPRPASFTVAVKSVFGRSAPDLSSPYAASLFRGQTYAVNGHSADDTWLSIEYSGAPVVWVLAAWGTVAGNPDGLPLALAAAAPTLINTEAPALTRNARVQDFVQVGSRARQIYQRGLALGNNPALFSRIGDCNSAAPDFLGAFDDPHAYRIGGAFAPLQETIDHFAGSFSRQSQAAAAGFSAAAVLDPAWSDPRVCTAAESPLACEVRLARPGFAFVSLGTNSTWQSPADFDSDMRIIVEYLLDRGVVPILGTKADNLEGDDHLNRIVVRLAADYDVPLWPFALAVRSLLDGGLGGDRYHLTWGPQVFDDPQSLQSG